MLDLKNKIIARMNSALKARDTNTLKTTRMLLAALKQKEIDTRIELTDADIIGIVQKMIKQRKDSYAQFQAAAREDLAQQEKSEIAVLEVYMPQQMSESKINALIESTLAAMDCPSKADMGKVMKILKEQLGAQADMGLVSQLLRHKL